MKKAIRIILICIIYSATVGLWTACVLNVLSMRMGLSLDGVSVVERHPMFFLFCCVLGIVAFAMLIAEIVLNFKFCEKLSYNSKTFSIQIILSLVLSVPMMGIWMKIIEIIHELA